MGKSCECEIVVLCHEREAWSMKTSQYRGDSEPISVLYPAGDTVDRTDQELELDRAGDNRLGNSPSGAVAAAAASPGPFPLRTLMVCFTIWLIATQAMFFDQLKFKERAQLLEETARSFGAPHVVLPNQEPSNLPSGAKVQRL
jgi:hypothetical protein